MPTYLLHGFRWPRPLVRIHIILQNLDDAAAEWLVAPATTATLLENFNTLYPTIMPSLPALRFIEQYDLSDLESKSQPYAYVADFVEEVRLGVDLDDMRARGISNDTWSAMVELRDGIAPGEKLSWFVVVCGDEERWAPQEEGVDEALRDIRSQNNPEGQREAGGQKDASSGFTYMHSPTQRNRDAFFSGTYQNNGSADQDGSSSGPASSSATSAAKTRAGGRAPAANLGSVDTGRSVKTDDTEVLESRFSKDEPRPSGSKGLKNMFGLRKSKSSKSISDNNASSRSEVPPLPR